MVGRLKGKSDAENVGRSAIVRWEIDKEKNS